MENENKAPFEVFGVPFSSKLDFTKRIGYKSQLSNNMIATRYGTWENFLRVIVYKELSDDEIIAKLKTLSEVSLNQKKYTPLVWQYLKALEEASAPELKNNLKSYLVNTDHSVSREALETAIAYELNLKTK